MRTDSLNRWRSGTRLVTTKEMRALADGFTVVGQADCIGGIRFADRSFFVATDIRSIENPQTGNSGTLNQLGYNPNVAAAAEVLAHEIGHLMGHTITMPIARKATARATLRTICPPAR